MFPTNSMEEFIRYNDSELRYLVANLCGRLKIVGSAAINDIVQDVYYRFLTSDIIKNYNPHFKRGKSRNPKMSTYLFPIISNIIRSHKSTSEYKVQENRCTPLEVEDAESDDVELAMRFNAVAAEYEGVMERNESSDSSDGLGADLKDFETKFLHSKANKRYRLKKRKNKKVITDGCTTFEVYSHLKEGLSNSEIAKMYGMSDMFVSYLKVDIAEAMRKHGISWNKKRKWKTLRKSVRNDSAKMS